MPEELPKILTYKGQDIATLSRDELEEVVRHLFKELEEERRHHSTTAALLNRKD